MFVLDLAAELSESQCPADRLHARAVGAYLGLAVGDALGATVEFLTPREIVEQYGEHRDIRGGGWLRLRKGQVTDDTEMALALGSAILGAGRVEAGAVAAAFSDWMRGKPVDIGNTVRRGIAHYRLTGATASAAERLRRRQRRLYALTAHRALYAGCRQYGGGTGQSHPIHTTHNNAMGDAGTLTVIRMVQAALLGGDKGHLKVLAEALVEQEPQYRYDRRRMENPGGFLVETLKAVFQALFATDSFEGALIDVVNRGGDADTTGAILGMIAGALYGVDGIPRRWSTALGPAVAATCRAQAQALLQMSPHCRGAG